LIRLFMPGSALVISNAGNGGSSHRDGNCFAVLADCVRFGKRLIETLLVPLIDRTRPRHAVPGPFKGQI
jgi:hypothetical protein